MLCGSDSKSCFHGKYKVKFFKLVCSDENFLDALSLLEESEVMSPPTVEFLERMICCL